MERTRTKRKTKLERGYMQSNETQSKTVLLINPSSTILMATIFASLIFKRLMLDMCRAYF